MTASRTFTWLIAVVIFAIVGLLVSSLGLTRSLQSVAQAAAEPVELRIRKVVAPLFDITSTIGSSRRLRDENRSVREENEQLRGQLAASREEAARAGDLSQLLRLDATDRPGQYTYARVVARDTSPLRRAFAINKGSNDGIAEGMSVVGAGGTLVGTIERTTATAAWVRLLSDRASAVNALLQESRALALVTGSSDSALHMEFLSQGADVKPGDTVLTSGLGGRYPPEILIGRVTKVEGGSFDVFKRVEVEPAARLSSIETVAVITDFRPQSTPGAGR